MKAGTSGMPGFIAARAVLFQLRQVNFVWIMIPADKAETEAFQASEGFNASRIQD
jgi:hypothetical protein